jgi:ATP-dependent helicase/nuclease subunit B
MEFCRGAAMSVQFILGRSGSGKSRFCIESIQKELQSNCDKPLILLVPEQGTYQAERAILDSEHISGYSRLNVLSFERLVFLLLNNRACAPVISQLARRMLIYKIMQDKYAALRLLGNSCRHIGLSVQIADVISEIYQYGKTVEQLDEFIEYLKNQPGEYAQRARLKFNDIRAVFEQYTKEIKGKFTDPDVQLSMGISQISKADFIQDGKLWVDGFSSFTSVELEILAELIKHTSQSSMALCMDYNEINLEKPFADELSIFYPVQKSYVQLLDMIKQINEEIKKPVLLGKTLRFRKNKSLCHLENNFQKDTQDKCQSNSDIEIAQAASPRAEVRLTARKILEIVQENNMKYRDIAVIASDLSGYENYVKAAFSDYGIPYFLDTRESLSRHPGVNAISSGLNIITGGYEPSDIFAYLKSGLTFSEPGNVDMLENYCLCFGISSESWKNGRDWKFDNKSEPLFDEEKINKLKNRALTAVKTLGKKWNIEDEKKIPVEDFVSDVYEFIQDSGLVEKLSEWIETAHKKGMLDEAERHRQFYSKVINALDEMAEIFTGTVLDARRWVGILESGFEQLKLGFVPAAIDQVLVGSVERSRHPNLKAVFILGATGQNFPVTLKKQGLIEDNERELAENCGFELAQSSAEQLACRQYLSYIAFTRSSEYLCICYPAADSEGRTQLRSRYVDNVENLFCDLSQKKYIIDDLSIEQIKSEFELRELICAGLGADFGTQDNISEYKNILERFIADGEFSKSTNLIKKALDYDNAAVLDDSVTKKLFTIEQTSSPSRLKCYAECPFKYFARYILSLKKRKEFELQPLDVGDFYHKVLDSVCRKLKADGKAFSDLSKESLKSVLEGEIQKIMTDDNFICQFKNRKDHNVYVVNSAIEQLEECVMDIREIMLAGSFRSEYSEVDFGFGRGDILKDFKLNLSGDRNAKLRGKIDRIDICREENAAVIFDYKYRNNTINYTEVYNGLNLQLLLYMLAVRESSSLGDIAGGFLMPVEVSAESKEFSKIDNTGRVERTPKGFLNGNYARLIDGKSEKKSNYYNLYFKDEQPYGYYNSKDSLTRDDFELLLDFAKRKAVSIAEKIFTGNISVKPYKLNKTPCERCDYRAICRYDWQINEPNYLETIKKKELLKKLRGDE